MDLPGRVGVHHVHHVLDVAGPEAFFGRGEDEPGQGQGGFFVVIERGPCAPQLLAQGAQLRAELAGGVRELLAGHLLAEPGGGHPRPAGPAQQR